MSEPSVDAPTLGDVIAVLERAYPSGSAQSWDHVGLVTGDPDQPVRRIHLALDPTLAVIEEARAAGADLLVTHHPLLLRGVHSVAVTSAKGASVTNLVVGDIALFVAHTNADVAADGVCVALAEACGVGDLEPLVLLEDRPLGRVGELPAPMTLGEFARVVATALPAAPVGATFNIGDLHAVRDPYTPSDGGIRIEQLKHLAALRDSGALTAEEFEAEKRRILGG